MSATSLLTSLHCNLDDGGLNEAAADIRKLRGMAARGELNTQEAAWLADLATLHAQCLGSLRPR